MGVPTNCRICDGPVRLLHRGSGATARSEAFSPTNHQPGQYGDLFRCERCGTVEQPSLPHGEALIELYRSMRDDRYLDEEAGRRATARRLLDAIGRHAPSGRLLDVGCGHGLLLDEARRRGYEVDGLEPSSHAAAHARDVLGLPVRRETLDSDPPHAYSVIVMADVLEHLDDPRRTIATAAARLAPGGVLCVVTPDPGSRTARLAGARWWGFLPAHTFLFPRTTLRDLLHDGGLDVAEDVPLVRRFTLRYWMAGLAERGGALGRGVAAIQRVTPRSASLSLSLGDERVMIARRGVRYATVAAGAGSSSPAVGISSPA